MEMVTTFCGQELFPLKWGIFSQNPLKCVRSKTLEIVHNNHHADRFALGTNRDEREQTNGRLSCKIRFEEEAYYNAR